MSSFAPLQFLKSAWNPLVWTAVDNGTDTRTSFIIYNGAVSTLPTDTGQYEVNCIMMHQAEKQLYANTGTLDVPNWEAFGPNSALPQPLVPGTFLFTDGATVYWAPSLVGQIQYNAANLNQYGILNFNNFLVASNDVPNSRINVDLDVTALASDATFLTALESNLDLANIGGLLNWNQIDQSTVLVDLATQVTGTLNSTNIDITNLESNLDLANIAGQIDLTTQVSGLLPPANIDVVALAGDATFLANLIPNLDNNVKVSVDGVTITGDGTAGNPLVAVGGGGGGQIVSASEEIYFNRVYTSGSSARQIDYSITAIKFHNYLITQKRFDISVFGVDALTGNLRPVSTALPAGANGFSVSADGNSLYVLNIATSGSNPSTSAVITLYQYDNNLSLVNTFTSASLSFGVFRSFAPTDKAAMPNPFFVQGNKLVILNLGSGSGLFTDDQFCPELEISGSTLINKTATNILFYQNLGAQFFPRGYAIPKNSNIFIQVYNYTESVFKYTYSSLTLSGIISTHTHPYQECKTSVNDSYGYIMGFSLNNDATVISEWTDTSTVDTWNPGGGGLRETFRTSGIYRQYTF